MNIPIPKFKDGTPVPNEEADSHMEPLTEAEIEASQPLRERIAERVARLRGLRD